MKIIPSTSNSIIKKNFDTLKQVFPILMAIFVFFGCTGKQKASEQEVGQKYFKAVGICDLDKIKEIRTSHQISINFQNIDNVSGLMLSSFKGNIECVKYFLEEKADINAKDINFRSALFYAIEGKKTDISLMILNQGADATAVDKFNLTPLMIASKLGQALVIDEILKKGVSINQADENGWTAIFFAVSAKQKNIVKKLVESGADITLKDSDGKTPRDLAYEDLSFEISDYLEEVMKNIKTKTKKSSK